MRRFYGTVSVAADGNGVGIRLDGRPARTPAERPLRLPNRKLAEAVAREWSEQGSEMDPFAMRMTGLANGAIDRVAPDRNRTVSEIMRYGETDLVCYRASGPEELRRLQGGAWDPLVAWMRDRYGLALNVTDGILAVRQPPLGRLRKEVAGRGEFSLAALHSVAAICCSAVIGLALDDGRLDAERAWKAAQLDESWQTERWGADPETEARRRGLRLEFDAAAAFLELAKSG